MTDPVQLAKAEIDAFAALLRRARIDRQRGTITLRWDERGVFGDSRFALEGRPRPMPDLDEHASQW